MLDNLNRHVLLPLAAARTRSRHLDYFRHLKRTQFDPPAVVAARQLAALKAVLHHAWDTVPFYRRAWAAAGVHPLDVKQLSDLDAFPVVTKADLRTHAADMLSTAYAGAKLRVKQTSGSTGVSVTVKVDERAVQWKAACTLRSDEWSGWRLGQRVAKVWGDTGGDYVGWKGKLRQRLVDRAVYLNTMGVTDERIAAFVAAAGPRPGLLFGHAHSLYLLAAKLDKKGVLNVRPSGVIATAMVLHDYQRAVIERVFGTPVTNRYGCEEVSLIASECEHHKGLHVNADGVFTEVMANDRDAAGKLLVTDLVNLAMPLIRYQVGDVVEAGSRACPCGRGLPILERVEGREADYVVTPDGRFVSGISLTDHFATLIAGAEQVQIVQEEVSHLRLRIVRGDAFTDGSRREIARLVAATFGPAMRHDVELVDAIPQEPSGKYRFCISKPARDHLQAMSA